MKLSKPIYYGGISHAILSFLLEILSRYDVFPKYDFIFIFLSTFSFIIFTLFFIHILVKTLFNQDTVTLETIRGGLATYLLIGFLWMLIYRIIFIFDLNSFSSLHQNKILVDGDLLYYSFVTITTLGFGDIYPVSPIARSLTMIESIIGPFFLAVFISRLVARYIAHRLKSVN